MSYAEANVRATSVTASALVLGAVLFAAMTMRISMMQTPAPPDAAAVAMVRPEAPPPPPTPPQRWRPPVNDPLVSFQTPMTMDVQQPALQSELPALFTPPAPPVVTDPHWTRRPRDLSRYYPARARTSGIEGVATLDCLVSAQGALACEVVGETPQGWGFGAAAQRIAREHRMVPASRDGLAVEARYRMRVPFELD